MNGDIHRDYAGVVSIENVASDGGARSRIVALKIETIAEWDSLTK